MAKGTYAYDPGRLKEGGKDLMRFELGDTMVEGGSDTTALADEEIQAALDKHPKAWKHAKLMLLESIFRRFSYEADTKTGPLTLSLKERAKLWQEEYEKLKKEVSAESCTVPAALASGSGKPPYFYSGMQGNPRAYGGGNDKCKLNVP